MQNLTGTWSCSDGMSYYFTQVGNVLFIAGNGASVGGSYNVGFGTIDIEAREIILQWADTPNSSGFGNKGVLFMDAGTPGKLTKKAGSTQFGIGNFTKTP